MTHKKKFALNIQLTLSVLAALLVHTIASTFSTIKIRVEHTDVSMLEKVEPFMSEQ